MDSTKTAEKAKTALGGDGRNRKKESLPATLTHSKSQQISDILNMYKAQISQALPQHVNAERIIQLCTTVIARNPKIKDCAIETTLGAVMQASILGLDVTPQFGQFFFVPRKNNKTGKTECTALIGYKGYLQLMRRSGEVSTVYAHVVCEGDVFEYELGLEPKLLHRPADISRGNMTHAYAVIKFKDGGYIFEVLTRADVMKAKNRSQAKTSKFSPWNTEDEEAMWRKTAIRRLSNYAPLSAEFIIATVADGVALTPTMFDPKTKGIDPMKVEPEDVEIIDTEPEEPKKTTKKKTTKGDKLKKEEADVFAEEMTKIKDEYKRLGFEQTFIDELGRLGYTAIDEVPEGTGMRSNVLKSLHLKLKELASDGNLELQL